MKPASKQTQKQIFWICSLWSISQRLNVLRSQDELYTWSTVYYSLVPRAREQKRYSFPVQRVSKATIRQRVAEIETNLRYHKSCWIFALLRGRIVAFDTRGTGHEYLFVLLLVAQANNTQSFRYIARPLRQRKRPQRSISRTFYANYRWLPRPGP